MLGEDYEEEYDSNIKDLFKKKPESNSINNNNQNDILEFSAKKSGEEKKEKHKKKKKKAVCENCKALTQKINELEQLNIELLKIKEKLSQSNEDLSQKNEELEQDNINMIKQNKELNSINKQLKEENNNLLNKNKELIDENNKIKKKINSNININNKEEINSKQSKDNINNSINNNTNTNNKKEIKNNNISSIDNNIYNKELIYSKKKEVINNNKFCTIEDFNKLKSIVEELQSKINNLEEWKKNIQNQKIEIKEKIETNEIKNIYNENNNKEINQKDKNIVPHKSLNTFLDDKIQKIKKNFEAEDNSYSDKSDNYSNAKTDQYNYISKKLKQKTIAQNGQKKELNLKVKRIPSKKKGAKSIKASNSIKLNTKNDININSNPSMNLTTNNIISNNIILSSKEKPKKKNQKFNSKIITNIEDLDLIARGLVKDDLDSLRNLRVKYKLIYRASDNGGFAADFHEKCDDDDLEGTLIIIKTKEDNTFGGYTTVSWDGTEEKKKDEKAFVFSINLEKLYFDGGNKYNIFCDKNKGPCFVGMFSIQEKILNGKGLCSPFGIQCFEGENDKYEINGGKNEFYVDELEVFQVIVKTN